MSEVRDWLRAANKGERSHQGARWLASVSYEEMLAAPARRRGYAALMCPWLSADQRMALAIASTPYMRGYVASHAPDLSTEQRMALAWMSTSYGRGHAACAAPGLPITQRDALTHGSTAGWRELAGIERSHA